MTQTNAKLLQAEDLADPIVVRLDVNTEEAKRVFEEVIASHPEFCLKAAHESSPVRLVILELTEDWDGAISVIQSSPPSSTKPAFFLTAPHADPHLLLKGLRAGVKEFFPQPVQRTDVERALIRFMKRHRKTNGQLYDKERGRIISVFGSNGGVGATSLAVNLAVSLQKFGESSSTVLVEVDQHAGDLPVFLDLTPSHSFREVAHEFSRLDQTLLTRILLPHASGVQILPSGCDDFSYGQLSPECIQPTLRLLTSLFSSVVVDCGHVWELATQRALEVSSSIVVVSTLSVTNIRRTRRILQAFQELGLQADTKLILNRYALEGVGLLQETEVVLNHKVFWRIPDDVPTALQALNTGEPSVLGASPTALAQSYEGLAKALGRERPNFPVTPSWNSRLWELVIKGRSKVKLAHA